LYLDYSIKQKGRFLFWSWEVWAIGGGAGVEWFFCGRSFMPGEKSLLWRVLSHYMSKDGTGKQADKDTVTNQG
jgi:hypothetical protein